MQTSVTFSGEAYVYFPEGIPYYSLYRTKRKINSFSELEYTAEKFVHLNPDFDLDLMKSLFVSLSDRDNGHIVRTYGKDRVEAMIESVYMKKKVPYAPKLRKIIFNQNKMLSKEEKMQIVGSIIGSKPSISEEDLSLVVDDLYLSKEPVSIAKLAELCDTSRYMIKKSITPDVMKQMEENNARIREENAIAKAMEAIEILTEGGDKLKMRKLKELTSIRNYKLLKKAVTLYQKNF
jgi:hypothetical protein